MLLRLRTLLSGGAGVVIVLVAGLASVLGGGWLMANASYDIWGACVALPVVVALALTISRLTFRNEFAGLRTAAAVGVAAKVAGTMARYWVANDAYGGAADSNAYHNTGRLLAGDLWSARKSIVEMIPHTEGTRFIDQVTGLLYSFVGSSKLAGFLWFGLMGYVGVVFTLKAAVLAVPDLHAKRYAWLCFLMPSLVFWPSSIGKEAWMSLTLGALAMGAAHLFRRSEAIRAIPWLVAGTVGAGMVRPHLAGIWLGALVVAMAWSVLSGRMKGSQRFVLGVLTMVALIGLFVVSKAALTYLMPGDEVGGSASSQVTSILDFTKQQTTQGHSGFAPPSIAGPTDYPVAIFRTLTRPFLIEATNIAALFPAVEMTFYLGLLAFCWRRVFALPFHLRRTPFVLYGFLICVMGGLVFATFGNLAILVRQRSLLMPMMLLLPCLPFRPARERTGHHPRMMARTA